MRAQSSALRTVVWVALAAAVVLCLELHDRSVTLPVVRAAPTFFGLRSTQTHTPQTSFGLDFTPRDTPSLFFGTQPPPTATPRTSFGRRFTATDTVPKPFERYKGAGLLAFLQGGLPHLNPPLGIRLPSGTKSPLRPYSPLAATRRPNRPSQAESVPVLVTAYCLQGNTQSGSVTREGIVAADPRVFPMHSEIDVSLAGNAPARYRVEDTGVLIKGRSIDIWVSDCSEARNFGRKRGIVTLARAIRR